MFEPETDRKNHEILVESARLLIRRPTERDKRLLERIFGDPVMMRYLGSPWTPPHVAAALQEWRADWGVALRWHGVLQKKDTGEVVGTAGISADTIPDEPGVEVAWFVLPAYQGQGFATEITRELVRFAFEELGVMRVIAETHPANPAATRVLEKLGFARRGERHHQYDYLPEFDVQALWELPREGWLRCVSGGEVAAGEGA